MLYLPGLKIIVADFLSCPPPSPEPSALSLLQWKQIQLTLKPWPLSKIAA
jgi:hypothetical protein